MHYVEEMSFTSKSNVGLMSNFDSASHKQRKKMGKFHGVRLKYELLRAD